MTEPTTTALTTIAPAPLALAGQAANRAAAARVFPEYRKRKAKGTLAAQADDLARFSVYLADAGVQFGDLDLANDPEAWRSLTNDPEAWRGLTWGLVSGFVEWQQNNSIEWKRLDKDRYIVEKINRKRGYAIGSINRSLSTVKTYAKLAAQACVLDPSELTLIKTVNGYSEKEGKRVNEGRAQTRTGHKKAEHTTITTAQARALKRQPDTPQGRRDRLLMCLLLDHGLRVSELAALSVEKFDLQAGTFTFYRAKVDKTQTHSLTADALRAALAYLAHDAPASGPLLRGSRKSGALEGGMSIRAIRDRVKALGEALNLSNLSPHDLRRYWVTDALRNRSDLFAVQEAGGWSSLAMVRHYAEEATIANEGVKLSS